MDDHRIIRSIRPFPLLSKKDFRGHGGGLIRGMGGLVLFFGEGSNSVCGIELELWDGGNPAK